MTMCCRGVGAVRVSRDDGPARVDTKAQAAALLGVDERTIERRARAGRINAKARPGFPTLYAVADVGDLGADEPPGGPHRGVDGRCARPVERERRGDPSPDPDYDVRGGAHRCAARAPRRAHAWSDRRDRSDRWSDRADTRPDRSARVSHPGGSGGREARFRGLDPSVDAPRDSAVRTGTPITVDRRGPRLADSAKGFREPMTEPKPSALTELKTAATALAHDLMKPPAESFEVRERCRRSTQQFVHSGRLVRQPCEACGAAVVQAHPRTVGAPTVCGGSVASVITRCITAGLCCRPNFRRTRPTTSSAAGWLCSGWKPWCCCRNRAQRLRPRPRRLRPRSWCSPWRKPPPTPG